LSVADWSEAFASHPRIGSVISSETSSVRALGWSAEEQSLASEAADSFKQALVEGNREYERRFHRIFIICATGKSVTEILENLKRRLNSGETAELHEAAEQLQQITQIRLRKWLKE
jgi:2-oxo-4-hydroxy-4-carboxy-5-ureidoimidazoline decarboxylase